MHCIYHNLLHHVHCSTNKRLDCTDFCTLSVLVKTNFIQQIKRWAFTIGPLLDTFYPCKLNCVWLSPHRLNASVSTCWRVVAVRSLHPTAGTAVQQVSSSVRSTVTCGPCTLCIKITFPWPLNSVYCIVHCRHFLIRVFSNTDTELLDEYCTRSNALILPSIPEPVVTEIFFCAISPIAGRWEKPLSEMKCYEG